MRASLLTMAGFKRFIWHFLTKANVRALIGASDSAAVDTVVTTPPGSVRIDAGFMPTEVYDLISVWTSPGIGTTHIADNAIDNAKLDDMAQATIKGRASGAGTGDPEDLTAAQARTILNVADGANAYVHPNHSGDVTSVADGAQTIANDAVTNAKAANMAAATIKGRQSGGGTGDPEDLTAAQVETILNVTSTSGTANAIVKATSGGKIQEGWIASGALSPDKLTSNGLAGMAILVSDYLGNSEWKQAAVFPSIPLFKSSTDDMDIVRVSGTSFPTSPVNGQHHTRTDLGDTMFVYSSARSGWLSVWTDTVWFAWSVDVSSSVYLYWSPGAVQFNASYGPIYGFQTKIVGAAVYMAASGTGAIKIYGSGTAITGSDLSLSAQTSKVDEGLNSNAIAAGTYLGAKRESGTLEGGGGVGMGYFRVRRFET